MPNPIAQKIYEKYYQDAIQKATSSVQEVVYVTGTDKLRKALREMDRKLARDYHREMTGVVKRLKPMYKALAPKSFYGRYHYPQGQRSAARSKPWG